MEVFARMKSVICLMKEGKNVITAIALKTAGGEILGRLASKFKTVTPKEGFELAVKLARKGVGYTQPDEEIRKKLRPKYAENADSLTLASQVIAIHFQTVAAANNYWK